MAATLPGLVVVATLFHVAAAALSPSEEKLALYTTPLRPDMDFRTWVLADDKCSWRGVDCDAQGYVVKLDMQHLDGSLPASFSAFKRLLELCAQRSTLAHARHAPLANASFDEPGVVGIAGDWSTRRCEATCSCQPHGPVSRTYGHCMSLTCTLHPLAEPTTVKGKGSWLCTE